MGKKKTDSQPRLQQSMGQLVSKAALAQMGPAIEQYVNHAVQNLGSQLASQQASTLETIFSRLVVLETLLMEKFGYTSEDLANRVSDLEDTREGLKVSVDAISAGDTVRLEVSTKTKDQVDYQGTSRLKVSRLGSGNNLGPELENALIGLKAGEVKELEFGKDKEMIAKFIINRVSKQIVEDSNGNSSEGQ